MTDTRARAPHDDPGSGRWELDVRAIPRTADPRRALADAAVSINRAVSPAGLLADVARQARAAVGAEGCVVRLADGRGEVLVAASVSPTGALRHDLESVARAGAAGAGEESGPHPMAVEIADRDGRRLGRIELFGHDGPGDADDRAILAQIAQITSVAVERLGRERELEASRSDLAEAQRIGHLGSWTHDLGTGRLSWSAEANRIFGLTAGASPGTYDEFLDLVHPEDRAMVAEAMASAVAAAGGYRCEHRIVRPGGEIRTVLARGEAERDADGRAARMLGTVLDVTSRRVAEDELRARATRITNLAADRRRLVAESLTAEERARQRIAEALHESVLQDLMAARQDVMECIGLTGDAPGGAGPLLARADAGLAAAMAGLREAVGELHPLTLTHGGLQGALEATALGVSGRTGLHVVAEVEPSATGPHDRLVLALGREFIVNAEKHAAARNVTLRATGRDGAVTLVVEDDGVGIPEGTAIDEFRVGHLGLASARERVEVLGGTLTVTSSPGRGTRIVAVLPAVAAAD